MAKHSVIQENNKEQKKRLKKEDIHRRKPKDFAHIFKFSTIKKGFFLPRNIILCLIIPGKKDPRLDECREYCHPKRTDSFWKKTASPRQNLWKILEQHCRPWSLSLWISSPFLSKASAAGKKVSYSGGFLAGVDSSRGKGRSRGGQEKGRESREFHVGYNDVYYLLQIISRKKDKIVTLHEVLSCCCRRLFCLQKVLMWKLLVRFASIACLASQVRS